MSYHLRREVASVREGPNYGRPSIHRQASTNTRYMQMLLDLDSVLSWHNLLVALCAWLLLAGFVIFPGTFTSIQNIDEQGDGIGNIERWILHHVKNLPLLVVAGVCCGLGAIGMIAFWIRWHSNYVWVCNRVFLPGTLHGIAGLLSTIVNVYTAQHKQWSITARVSAIVEGACLGACGLLFLFYSYWLLDGVKRHHHRELGFDNEDLGPFKRMKARARQASPEPGRIVSDHTRA